MEEQQRKDVFFQRQKVVHRRKFTEVHSHERYEVYYLVCGKTKYFIGDEIFWVEQGNFVFVPKGMHHKTDSEDCMHNERLLLHFNDAAFSVETLPFLQTLCEDKLIHIPQNHAKEVEEILLRIETEFCRNPQNNLLLQLYLQELVVLLCRLKRPYRSELSETDALMHRISHYISTNYTQNLTLHSLSRDFSISESYLSRQFKAVTGIGINEYITYVRIMNGERLLKTTTQSITEISALCGFRDSNYFSTVFKRIRGVTPRKFAQNCREGTER